MSRPDSGRWWSGPLDVEGLALRSVEAARTATERLAVARGLDGAVTTTPELVAAAFAAHDHLTIDGRAPVWFAPFSRFVETADGWVRLHGNYPHHAAVIRDVLGVRTVDDLVHHLRDRSAEGVVDEITEAGGIATVVRTVEEWQAHPHAAATAADPWYETTPGAPRRPLPRADLPLTGVRVLDLTRVLAGPSCSQLLACLGADVLRIDPPVHPEILEQYLANGMGKRSVELDLRHELATVRTELLPRADVVLTGYRPDALTGFGLDAEALGGDRRDLVVATLSAWGDHGPWGDRRGFDSIVQAASGIAHVCRTDEGRPGALPVQALDYATGYILAAEVIGLLATNRGGVVRASLLGAARTLLTAGAGPDDRPLALATPTVSVSSPHGALVTVPPPVLVHGRTLERDVGGYAAAAPAWQ